MSLLERLGGSHLSDATLARLWTEGLEAERPGDPHLDSCAVCRARYDALDRWLGGIGETLRDEADERLTPERLTTQQAQIARRLEAIDRPARVLAFPKAARAVINGHSNVRRWVAVAAAACLIAGFSLGQVFPMRHVFQSQPAALPSHPLTAAMARGRAEVLKPDLPLVNDDELLLSNAFARSHVVSLTALDDMTPHARDLVLNRRNKQYK